MEWELLTHWKVQIEIVGRTWTLDEHGDFQKEWFVQNMPIVIEPWRSSSGSIKATNMQTQESKQAQVPFTKEGGGGGREGRRPGKAKKKFCSEVGCYSDTVIRLSTFILLQIHIFFKKNILCWSAKLSILY
jgi:hypothetical protein